MIVRSRFAPSPTGDLHLGSIRTALYAWLHARRHGGEFILRIEDSDQERSTEQSTKGIIEGLSWLGIDCDEGPYYQSQRLERYREIADKMLAEGSAYRCYCSKERLAKLREEQLANKEKPKYDGHCRDKDHSARNEPYVVRFKNPQSGTVSFDDEVNGTITFNNDELDDLIIMRADGYPTYNFCVVVDDIDMRITHVVRGAGHINNTPRQINIFHALGAPVPTFAHAPLILGPDGKLLAKRHGATSILQYRDMGYLPEAMLNYLARLGWSHGDQEIFSRQELIDLFDCKDINKSSAAVNPEKLLWLNRHYIKTLDPQVIAEAMQWQVKSLNINLEHGPDLKDVIVAQRERCETLCEIIAKSRFFYEEISHYEEHASKFLNAEALDSLRALIHRLEILNSWTKESLHQTIEDIAKEFELKLGKVAQPVRVAVTGTTISPPIDITLQLLGKRKVLDRLTKAIEFIIKKSEEVR